eukprot:XP_011673844.1 PREDICTED: uncharacterized protein LOC105442888 isoform X1 [Strongylocentrotus purpuratus]
MCPADIQQTVIVGSNGTYVTWDPPVVSDNSGTVVFVSSSSSSGDLFTVGVTPVTYTYSDFSGNSNSCTFTVTINTVPSGTPCNPNRCQNGDLCVPTDLTNYQCICRECLSGTNCETKMISIIAVGILLAFVALYGLIITLMYLHLRRSNIALKQSVSDREGQELDPYTSLDATTMKQAAYEDINATRDGNRGHTNAIEGLENENQTIVKQTNGVKKSNLGVADGNTEPEYEFIP